MATPILTASLLALSSWQSPFPEELKSVSFTPDLRGMAITPDLRQYYHFNGGGDRVFVRRSVRAPTGDWYQYKETAFTTSYMITDVTSRDGDKELFVAGIARDGSDVIEKWTFGERTGGYGLRMTSAVSDFGDPSQPYSAGEMLFGGVFVEPPTSLLPAPTRAVVTEGDFGHVRCLEVDPEGRFLLFQSHETHDLLRIMLDDPEGSPETLLTVAEVPHLAETMTLKVMFGESVERRYFLTEQPRMGTLPASSSYTMLDDANNDGVLDPPMTMLRSAYKASSVGQEDWHSPYFVVITEPPFSTE